MEKIKQAIEHHKKGEFLEAEKLYLEFLEQNPKEAKAHHLLGLLYFQNKKFDKAQKPLEEALLIEKSSAYYCDLGLVYFELKQFSKALECLRQVEPEGKNALICSKILHCANELGLKRIYVNNAVEYLENYPEDIDILRNLAKFSVDIEEFEIALKYNLLLIEKKPNDNVAFNNLGLILESFSEFDRAQEAFEKSLDLKEEFSAKFNLAVLLRRKKEYERSNQLFIELRNIIEEKDFSKLEFSRSVTLLCQKNFYEGLRLYVDHLKTTVNRRISEHWWDGKSPVQGTLVICPTGGLGDLIMFSRYFDFINLANFKEVVCIVPASLAGIMQYNFPMITIKRIGEQFSYTAATSPFELPLIYDVPFDKIPSVEKYLVAQPDFIEKFEDKFDRKKLNVGLFFQGNKGDRSLRNRSIALSKLSPIFEIEKTRFYSLQPEDTFIEELNTYKITDFSDVIKDFSDTAGIIQNLDIVVTIDSSVVHLAGAMGKKTILLLPWASEWRWFDNVDKCDWYQSVEIIRQTKEGNWTDVVERLKARLEELAEEKAKN